MRPIDETIEDIRQQAQFYQGKKINSCFLQDGDALVLKTDYLLRILDAINQVMESTDVYCKEDFSLEKLAVLVNSNSKYVSQVINETYHRNFNIYINEYRIQEARIRLADVEKYGNYTIKAIAESVGYKSTTTFTNAFKSITGITPSIFQKMAKEDTEKKREQ